MQVFFLHLAFSSSKTFHRRGDGDEADASEDRDEVLLELVEVRLPSQKDARLVRIDCYRAGSWLEVRGLNICWVVELSKSPPIGLPDEASDEPARGPLVDCAFRSVLVVLVSWSSWSS